jgi:diguanylate cyclase (GGDEF)-like protein
MRDPLDPAYLPEIKTALSDLGWMPPLPVGLQAVFAAAVDSYRRLSNRRVILALALIFDLFLLQQWKTTPDILVLSGILRLAVLTPCTLLFCLLDAHGRLGRGYDLFLLALAVAPSIITTALCLMTHEMVSQPEIYGTPLILLFTGLLLRMGLPYVVANVLICTPVYIAGIIACPMLMADDTGTFIFIQAAICAAVIIFNVQIETRDRRVFLLTQNERIRRALVADQNSALRREAQTDALTQLANRRCFDETLSARWIEALLAGTSISLIMIDVDHFKKYNDRYGHVMGDDCLRRVAAALAREIRSDDLLARFGGEEFAAILSNRTEQEALTAAERLRTAVLSLALPNAGAGTGAVVTASLGISTLWPATGRSVLNLIEEADRNLYAAKRAGRNCVAAGDAVRYA